MPSLINSNAGAMSSKTWLQAKQEVAQVVGGQNDPDSLLAAKAQIRAVLEDWNTRRNWQFLQVIAPDIAVVAGTSTYDLPTTFKRPYSVRLLGSPRTLWYVTRREYNRLSPYQSPNTYPTHYTLFNAATTGQIELIPANGVAETMRVWYYRPMVEEDEDDATLDVLGRYTNYVLDGARARLLGLKGPTEKLPFWKQEMEAGFAKAQADDENIPDEDAGFAPGPSGFYGPPHDNSFAWVDWGW